MSIRWSEHPLPNSHALVRRGLQLGFIAVEDDPPQPDADAIAAAWRNDEAARLTGIINLTSCRGRITQARKLMKQVLEGESPADMFTDLPYAEWLAGDKSGTEFILAGAIHDEGDPQEIEKVLFDAEGDGEVLAEELWCKASWLSYHEEDASLRFRFSFGMEGCEDVAADPGRQLWAARLCDALFPESAAVTANLSIRELLGNVLGGDPEFVERIVYFNAPNGGAQLHHDVERGHAGVIYAQMSGSTFWLALGKPTLIDDIIAFVNEPAHAAAIAEVLPSEDDRSALKALAADRGKLSGYMDQFDHELVEALIDRSPGFTARMVEKGYGHILQPGDALLLPQRDLDTCVWHSVFCLGDEPGEGLSFALRKTV